MMHKNFCFLVFFIVLTGCGDKKDSAAQTTVPPPPNVDVIIAENKTIQNKVEANGTVLAAEFTELHPEVSGRVVYLNVPEGNYIKEGALIARINDADLQAQMAKTQVQLDLAVLTEQRLQKLLSINGINQADYDAALNQVNSLRADLNYTKALIDKTVVKAPFSGVLGLRQISNGAYVTPSTIIASIQATDRLKIDFTLPDTYSSIVHKGAIVDIQADGSNAVTHATIIATEPQVNQDTRNLIVRALLNSATVNPGSFVKVYLNIATDRNSIMVPTNAIIPDAKKKKVLVVKGGTAVFTDVETGVRSAGMVEVTKGLAAGDSIAVTGILFARPGKPVAVKSIKKIEDITQ